MNISLLDSYNFYTAGSYWDSSVCRIDDTHALIAFYGADGDGFLSVLSTTTNDIAVVNTIEHDTSDCKRPRLCQIDATHYALAYYRSSTLYVKTFSIDGSYNITEEDAESLSTGLDYDYDCSIVKIDSTHIAVGYHNADMFLTVSTLSLDANFDITLVDTEYVYMTGTEVIGGFSSMCLLDSTHIVIASGYDGNNLISVVAIDGSYNLSTTSVLQHDSAGNNSYSSIAKIDSTHVALCFATEGRSQYWNGFIKTFSFNGSYVCSEVSSFEFQPTYRMSNRPTLIYLQSGALALTYQIYESYAKLLTFKLNAFAVSAIDSEYNLGSGSSGWSPSIAELKNGKCLVALTDASPYYGKTMLISITDTVNSSRNAKITGIDRISALKDNFDDNSVDTAKWNNWGEYDAGIAEANQQLELTTPLTGGYLGIKSDNAYDLTGSSISSEVKDAGNQSLESFEAYPLTLMDSAGDNYVEFNIIGGELNVYKRVAASSTRLAHVTYNSTNHRFLRIREASGTTYWDASPDGESWSNIHSVANPITVTALYCKISAGTWQTEASATTMKVDNLNYLPATNSRDAKITGKADTNTSRSAKIIGKDTANSARNAKITGWKPRYWVGGTGNVNDTAHWSLTSGGAGGASLPTDENDVIFDENSFLSTGQTVTINSAMACRNMDWSDVTNNPTLAGYYSLTVYGSLKFVSGMTITWAGDLYFRLAVLIDKTIDTAGKTINGYIGIDGGNFTFLSGLTQDVSSNLQIADGGIQEDTTVNFGSYTYNLGMLACYGSSATVVINLGSATINLDTNLELYSGITVNKGTSTIKFTGSHEWGTLNIQGFNLYNVIFDTGYGGDIYDDCSIDNLTLAVGQPYYLGSGKTLTINTAFVGSGTAGNLISFRSFDSGVQNNFVNNTGSNIELDYVNVKDNNATGGWYAGSNSVDSGNNTGWYFDIVSSRSAKITGQDSANDSRNAKITGKVTTADFRNAKISGQDTANSSRNAKVTGKQETSDYRLAKITGQASDNSSRNAKVWGQLSDSSNRNAKVTGKQNDNNARNAKISGKDTIASSRNAKVRGSAFDSSFRNAKIIGQVSDVDMRLARIIGKATIISFRNAKISGQLSTEDARNAKITGQLTVGDFRNASIWGRAIGLVSRFAKLTGGLLVNNFRNAKIHGQDTIYNSRSAKIHGRINTYSSRNAKVHGQTSGVSVRGAVIVGAKPDWYIDNTNNWFSTNKPSWFVSTASRLVRKLEKIPI